MSADISALIEQIRAGLESVTDGPWCADDHIVKAGDIGDAWAVFEKFEDDPPIIYCHEWQQEANAKHIARCSPDNIRRLLEHIAELEAKTEWRDIESAPRDEEVLVAYWRWRNSMSPGSVVVQSATLTEHHGKGIWSWVVSDNKHGPFPLRGYCEGDFIGWMPLPARPTKGRT